MNGTIIKEMSMCKAIKDMRELERAEGALETLIRLVKKGRLTLEEASEEAGLSPEAFKEKVRNLEEYNELYERNQKTFQRVADNSSYFGTACQGRRYLH